MKFLMNNFPFKKYKKIFSEKSIKSFCYKMSAALSPTSVATNSDDSGPITAKDFAKYVNYYQQTHKAIVRLTSLVYRLPASQPFYYRKPQYPKERCKQLFQGLCFPTGRSSKNV